MCDSCINLNDSIEALNDDSFELDSRFVPGCQCHWCQAYRRNPSRSMREDPTYCEWCNEKNHISSSQYACGECRDNRTFAQCYSCGVNVPNEPEFGRGERFHCTTCIESYTGPTECALCADSVAPWDSNSVRISGGRQACHDCSQDLVACYSCGFLAENVVAVEMYTRRGPVDAGLCQEDCHDRYSECDLCGYFYKESSDCRCSIVHNYSYKPSNMTFHHSDMERKSKVVYFGVELEVLGYRDALRDIAQCTGGLFFAKRDSSINGDGYELVSEPFTWTWLRENKDMFVQMFDVFDSYNIMADESCGMHIHVSRAGLKRTALYKAMDLVFNTNDSEFMDLSNRNCSRAHLRSYCTKDVSKDEYIQQVKYPGSRGGPRAAINTNPSSTIEFRMFGSVDTYEGFMRNMETCVSIIEYAKATSIRDVSFGDYVQYVRENHERFPHLNKEL